MPTSQAWTKLSPTPEEWGSISTSAYKHMFDVTQQLLQHHVQVELVVPGVLLPY